MTELECADCHKKMRNATFEDMDGLVFMPQFKIWVCPNCNKRRASHVISAQ